MNREFGRIPEFGPERARLYAQLFGLRQLADYGVTPVNPDTVHSYLEPARELMDRLRELAASGDA